MEYYFKVAEFICCIDCKVGFLDERLKVVVSSFSETSKQETNNVLTINNKNFVIKIDEDKYAFDIELTTRDLYQIFYIFVTLVVRKNKTYFLTHSSVASKDGKGILIIGDYASGKTTLANTFEKEGYEVNAADRTICSFKNGKLYNIEGTRKVVSDNVVSFLGTEATKRKVEIKTILFLDGISDNGDLKMNELVDKTRIKKKLFYGMTNVFFAPFENANMCMCNLVSEEIFELCKNVINSNLRFIAVRGDANKIVQSILLDSKGE